MMPPLQRLSTRYGLVIAVVLLLGMAVILLLAGYFVFRGTNELRDELSASFSQAQTAQERRTLRASSVYLGQQLFNLLYNLDITALNAEIARINDWLEPRSVHILDAQGRVITDGTRENPEHGRQQPLPEALQSRQSVIETMASGKLLYFRIAYAGEILGYTRIAFSNARELALLQDLQAQVSAAWKRFVGSLFSIGTIGLLAVILVSLLIAWRLSISLSRPLRDMSYAAEQFASGNLTHQLPDHGDDELGRLACSLNSMASDLQKTGCLLQRAQEIASFGSWEWQPQQARLQLSHGVYPILGLTPAAQPYQIDDLLDCVLPSDRDRLAQVLKGELETAVSFELRAQRSTGELRVLLVKGESERSEDGRLLASFGTIQDITDQRRAQEQLVRLANFDTLTGLPNRNLFYDRLRHALLKARRERRQVALFFLDLDRFKEINDALGHDVGDALLRCAAQRLNHCIRDSDTLARMGGDEFTLMIEELSEAMTPSAIAKKLIDALSVPFDLAGRQLFVSASVGIALFPDDADNLETLIKQADIAMYAAKEQGRGSFHFFTAELQRAANERLLLEQQLRRAIDNGEMSLHFQPQVRSDDGRLVGIEGLLRWGTGEATPPPVRFIPLLEATGLITQLTESVLHQACEALLPLQQRGLIGLRVSVNLSARQLGQPDLPRLIESTLAAFDLPPQHLELEITETTLLDNEACQSNAARLTAIGVRLAIDDFGTGYSSLIYLKQFAINVLKIDRSFVHDMLFDQDDAQIVQAVIGLASGLGIECVAEGAESEAQRTRLQFMGCNLIQGYLIARPMALPDLLSWFDAWQGAMTAATEAV